MFTTVQCVYLLTHSMCPCDWFAVCPSDTQVGASTAVVMLPTGNHVKLTNPCMCFDCYRIKALWNWMILVYTFLYCIIFQGFNENSVDLKTQTHNRATQHKVFIVIHTHIVFHLSCYVFALCLCELLSTLCIVLYSCICVCIFSFQVALTCWAHPMVHPKKTSQSLIACALPPLSPLVLTLSLSL